MIKHYSVMLNEVIEALDIKPNGIYVDGTLGRAGHTKAILERLDNGFVYCFDKDETAINESKIILKDYLDKVKFINQDFKTAKQILSDDGINEIDGFLLDLGVSSPQFDEKERGFSYRYDSRLDMRMNQKQSLSAYEVVNNYEFNDLVRILYQYGEEKCKANS